MKSVKEVKLEIQLVKRDTDILMEYLAGDSYEYIAQKHSVNVCDVSGIASQTATQVSLYHHRKFTTTISLFEHARIYRAAKIKEIIKNNLTKGLK